jgi:hypothetical protein
VSEAKLIAAFGYGALLDRRGETMGNYYAIDQRTRWEKLKSRLFPVRSLPIPESGEHLMSHTIVVMDWADRLRVLIGGRVHILVQTETDVRVIDCVSKSVVYVEAP